MTKHDLKELAAIGAELGASKEEIEALREQVKVLQSDANSWQSGYDKGRNDGGKHRKSEVEQLRQHKNEYMDAAEVTRKALLAEIESLRNGLKNARYRIEQGRVWNGMGWTLTGLHAHQQQKALDEIEAALSQQPEPAECPVCCSDEPHTGTCGSSDPRALCNRAKAEPAPAQDEPVYQLRNTAVGNVWRDADKDAYDSAAKLVEYERRALYRRPAQTEQQPIGYACQADLEWEDEPIRICRERFRDWQLPVYAAPIAQTALQPEQSKPANKLRALAEIWDQNADEADEFGNAQAAEALRLAAFELRATLSAPQGKFRMGDLVKKSTGSEWEGRVVGWYSTEQTPEGYAVESSAHRNSVQIYPAKALELVPMAAKEESL
jgi:hypothetical protein